MTGKRYYGLLTGMGLMLMLRGAPAQALQAEQPQPTPEALPAPSQPPPGHESQPQPEPGQAELLHVLMGQPLEVSSPSPIKRFSVSSPGVIDAELENPSQLRIEGKAQGGVSLVVQDENGQSQTFYVYVDSTDTSLAAQSPEALPDTTAPAQVQKKAGWLGWAVIASIVLLAGTLFKVRRQQEPCKLDLRSPELVPPDSSSEPALSPPNSVHPEEDSPVKTAVHAAATQAEDAERVSREPVEQLSRQLTTEALAAMARLREEIKNSSKALEESEQRLAGLAEAKMASLRDATRQEFSTQTALALQEHARETNQATMAELEFIKKAASEAVAQIEAEEEKREAGLAARAREAEERLAGVSVALETVEGRLRSLVEGFEGRVESSLQALRGKAAKQAEDLEKLAQEMGGRWSEQFQNQAEATLEKLREEANQARRAAEESQRQPARIVEPNLERLNQAVASAAAGLEAEQKKWLEESRRQLSSVVQAKVESLSQFAVGISAGLEAEHKQLKSEYETSRREFEHLVSKRPPAALPLPSKREYRPRRRWIVPKLAMATGILLAVTVPVLAVYLWPATVMQLQAQPPAEFIDESPNWSPARRLREHEMARAYWQVAVTNLQGKYPFGSELPTEPPSEFDAANNYLPSGGAKTPSETRDHYWQKLRKIWAQRDSWEETSDRDAQWASRLKHILGQSH
ncbi:MAG: pilus assembly protein N-terminal domain-containing protein [Terriglobia bacterium]|jgi:hypothetical protein